MRPVSSFGAIGLTGSANIVAWKAQLASGYLENCNITLRRNIRVTSLTHRLCAGQRQWGRDVQDIGWLLMFVTMIAQ